MMNYTEDYYTFSWDQIRQSFSGLPDEGGLNIAHEAIDRHAKSARANHVAIRCLTQNGQAQDYTYADMQRLSNRFANVLQGLGVRAGEGVFTLIGRIPELYVTAFGTLKNRSVFCPLFSTFGPEPVRERLAIGRARVLVTTASLYLRKVKPLRASLPNLEFVLIIESEGPTQEVEDTLDFNSLMATAADHFTIGPTDPQTIALLHFTSGTTGRPKGAIHVHDALTCHYATGKLALDIHPADVFWCTADPGWVTGTSYGIIAPLAIGATLIVDTGEFEVKRWCEILTQQRVTVWYTAPTALRMMKRTGDELLKRSDLSHLRFIASVGEPLDAETVRWGQDAFDIPVHDTWWQTETGAIMIANYAAMDVKPGSMGRPLPGIEAALIKRKHNGGLQFVDRPNVRGELALRAGWPSMFRGYLSDDERYRQCFVQGWYLTGDLASRDEEGYFWFAGRVDDVIKSAGHLIGPFEVENVLLTHPKVADVAVIGTPDPLIGEIVKAFVLLKSDVTGSEALERELMVYARKRLGTTLAPREIEFRPALPRNRSGKVMRRLLRAQERGSE